MLDGKTSFKTQKVAHQKIICIGTELLNEVQHEMREDKEKAVRDAVAATEAKAAANLKHSLDELREKMNAEREQALEEARRQTEEQMAEIMYRCEVAERKRARLAQEKFQQEKLAALQKAAQEAEKRKQEEIRDLTAKLTRKLRNEAALQREIAIGEALANARKNAEKRLRESIEKTKQDCEQKAAEELGRVMQIHENKCDELNQRINNLIIALQKGKDERNKLEELFQEMKEDYKRFQDYTRGFHSDYLMK